MRSLDDGLLIQALLPYRDSIWIDTGTGFDKRSNAGENFVSSLRSTDWCSSDCSEIG